MPFLLQEMLFSEVSKIRELKSGIATEQKGVAHMSKLAARFYILHLPKFIWIKIPMFHLILLNGIVAERVCISRHIASRTVLVDESSDISKMFGYGVDAESLLSNHISKSLRKFRVRSSQV